MNITTHIKLKNGADYPCIWINWTQDSESPLLSYDGELSLWHDKNDKDEKTHRVYISQSLPLGLITIDFDSLGYGCWTSGYFDGVGITERDLQWATLWAAQALRNRRTVGDLRKIEY